MSQVSTEQSIDEVVELDDTPPSSVLSDDKVSRKRSSPGGSESDDPDFYSELISKYNRKFPKGSTSHERIPSPPPKKDDSDISDLESDSDDDSKEVSALDLLLEKGKQFQKACSNVVASDMAQIDAIKNMDNVSVRHEKEYLVPGISAAEDALSRIRDEKAYASRCALSPLMKMDEIVVIDASGKERVEMRRSRVSSSPANTSSNRTKTGVSILVQDLHLNNTTIEHVDIDTKMEVLVELMASRWHCDANEVLLSKDGSSVKDLWKTMRQLEIPLDGVHAISAMRLESSDVTTAKEKATPKDTVTLRFQCSDSRPVNVAIEKNIPMMDQLENLKQTLKLASITRMVFDNEELDMYETPVALELEDDFVIDVYSN